MITTLTLNYFFCVINSQMGFTRVKLDEIIIYCTNKYIYSVKNYSCKKNY